MSFFRMMKNDNHDYLIEILSLIDEEYRELFMNFHI